MKKKIEGLIEEIIPREAAGDFNQSLIELGASCLPAQRGAEMRGMPGPASLPGL